MALHILNFKEMLKQKPTLKKVEHTVMTRKDGSRYKHNNINGTNTELPKAASQGGYDDALNEMNSSSDSAEGERGEFNIYSIHVVVFLSGLCSSYDVAPLER